MHDQRKELSRVCCLRVREYEARFHYHRSDRFFRARTDFYRPASGDCAVRLLIFVFIIVFFDIFFVYGESD